MENNNWQAYGDVNPFEHGGTWMRLEEGSEVSFEVVAVREGSEDETADLYRMSVDISDSWIDVSAVSSFADLNESSTDADKVIALLDYYGYHEFGGEFPDATISSEEEMVEELAKYGIVVERAE